MVQLTTISGAEPTLFKSKSVCMRLHYRYYAEEGFFHSFRAPSTRLFNNIVINVRNQEEAKGILRTILGYLAVIGTKSKSIWLHYRYYAEEGFFHSVIQTHLFYFILLERFCFATHKIYILAAFLFIKHVTLFQNL